MRTSSQFSCCTYLPSSVPQHHAKTPAAADRLCSTPAPHAGTCCFWAGCFALPDCAYTAWLSSLESAWYRNRALFDLTGAVAQQEDPLKVVGYGTEGWFVLAAKVYSVGQCSAPQRSIGG